jgi:hypothetical protein
MSKSVLIIDDYQNDFVEFHKLIFDKFKFHVYPNRDDDISTLFGLKQEPSVPKKQRKTSFKNAVLDYIVNNKLYIEISVIILDIKILDDYHNDKTGLELLGDIRHNLHTRLPEKYEKWGKVVPVIALTHYPEGTYKEDFMNNAGSLLQFFQKDNVKVNPSLFKSTLINFDTQMTEIYSLFYDPDLKSILNEVLKSNLAINDLKEIASLSLYSQIASMDEKKRNALIDNFSDKLIKYTTELNGFMIDIESVESKEKIKSRIVDAFNSSTNTISFISSILSFSGEFVKAENIINIIEKSSSLMSDLLMKS